MTDRPILFSAAMVRALLDGRKTQTRRITKQCFAQGDRLWVRETFSGLYEYDEDGLPPREWHPSSDIWYLADGNPTGGDWTKPKPGIHMPRWASRLTLTVTDVRVQRLTDINEIDAMAEGIIRYDATETEDVEFAAVEGGDIYATAVDAYQDLWNRINGALAWAANPWVVALTFVVERRNIDSEQPR